MKINKKFIAGLGIAIALTAGITVNSQKLGGGLAVKIKTTPRH